MDPNIKLIWILREPVARAYSNYWHAIVRGAEKYSFEKCVKKELNNETTNVFRKYLERSKYVEQIEMYLQYFSIDQMYFMTFEDFVESPQEELEKLFEFLNVSKEKYEMPINELKSNQRKTLPLSFTIQYHVRKILGNKGLLFKVFNKVNRKGVEKYPPLDYKLKHDLKEFYKPYNVQLKRLIGLESIDKWN